MDHCYKSFDINNLLRTFTPCSARYSFYRDAAFVK